jgi:hypothetical protein
MFTLKLLCFAFCASASEHEIIPSIPSHVVFVFWIPSLIDLLQLKDQSKNVSPFDTHPINIWISFSALCIYCLSLATKMEIQTNWTSCSKILGHVIVISGALASVSLATIFLPHFLGWLFLIIWAFLPIIRARHFLICIYRWICLRIKEAIYLVCNISNRLMGHITVQQRCLPM